MFFFYGLHLFLQGVSIVGILCIPSFGIMEDVEFLIFHLLNMVYVDEMPSINSSLGIDLMLLCLPSPKVSSFHFIFYLNGVFVATQFEVVQNTRPLTRHETTPISSRILVLKLELKEFLEICMTQFIEYIWFIAQHHNINYHLDQIQCETQITIKYHSRVLGQKCCT